MTVIQKTYTFVANTRALAEQVNQDFDDAFGFLTGDHHNYHIYSNATPITSSGLAPGLTLTQSGMVNQSALQQISAPGIILPSALPSTSQNFGDGSDGDVTISSPTTLVRDMFYHNLTVNSTLTTNGYKIYCSGTLNGTGTITWGTATVGQDGTSSSSGGAGGSATGAGFFRNVAGASGASSTPGGSASSTHMIGSPGGSGGSSNNGAGGTSTGSANVKINILSFCVSTGLDFSPTGTSPYVGGVGGGGGCQGSLGSAYGGGGGASGGVVWIAAKTWAGTFSIVATGANGGHGGDDFGNLGRGAGGGGGGGGGASVVIYNTKSWTGTYNLAGGTGGTPGNSGGVAGSNGSTGVSYEINAATLI